MPYRPSGFRGASTHRSGGLHGIHQRDVVSVRSEEIRAAHARSGLARRYASARSMRVSLSARRMRKGCRGAAEMVEGVRRNLRSF